MLSASSRLAICTSSALAITQGHTTKWQIAQQTSQQCEASTAHPNREAIAEHLNQDLQYWLPAFGCRSQLSWMERRSREASTRDFFRNPAGEPPLAADASSLLVETRNNVV
ncbi:uncharacterized protein PHALS_06842 [Plasmopara halstedii]|uniref:Uncharacterized protein n=1 Tax=Plasmopara halstedii TaxID=4781 RepID=A0A0P1B3K0_PLAHL|nr:uncharacterized protein PHALS_06842 [Plasmopara halstedii]CEG49054.1 hypothetical protein PHALS_06842 [Plasmopara halstedii]|eukprot:XP_024585423.1 hypothetical protein PHALS_06842 [Plasmopara halstedii]